MCVRHAPVVAVAVASMWGIAVSIADTPQSAVPKETRCVKNSFGGKTCLDSDGYTLDIARADGKVIRIENALPGPYFGPQCVTDVVSGIKVCVEPDGHHLKAIGPSGSTLWRRNPFVDAKLPLYRTPEAPTINVIRVDGMRPPAGRSGQTVWIMFASSQFGEVELSTGEFKPEGQN